MRLRQEEKFKRQKEKLDKMTPAAREKFKAKLEAREYKRRLKKMGGRVRVAR